MSDPLAKIREQAKAGKLKAAPKSKPAYPGQATSKATGPISPSELEAIYARGSKDPGTHSHTSGLKAVYEAGAKGLRV